MGFETFRVELRGGRASSREVDEAVRKLSHVRPDPDSVPTRGSRLRGDSSRAMTTLPGLCAGDGVHPGIRASRRMNAIHILWSIWCGLQELRALLKKAAEGVHTVGAVIDRAYCPDPLCAKFPEKDLRLITFPELQCGATGRRLKRPGQLLDLTQNARAHLRAVPDGSRRNVPLH